MSAKKGLMAAARLGIYVCACACMVLLCFEAVVRIFPGLFDYYFYVEKACLARCDADIGLVIYKPKSRCQWARPCLVTRDIQFNSRGFRDAEWDPSVRYDVGLLGDSNVLGLEHPNNATFSAQLSSLLPVRVMNAGHGAVGQVQELMIYRKFIKPLRPKTVVMYVLLENDLMENSCELTKVVYGQHSVACGRVSTGGLETVRTDECEPDNWDESMAGWRGTLKRACRGCTVLHRMWFQKVYYPVKRSARMREQGSVYYSVYQPSSSPEWEEAWTIMEYAIRDLQREVQQDGGTLAVVLLPHRFTYLPTAKSSMQKEFGLDEKQLAEMDFDYPAGRFQGLMEKLGVPFYSAGKDFEAYYGKFRMPFPYFFYRCDWHFNPVGSFLVSNLTARFLLQHGLTAIAPQEAEAILSAIERNLSRSPREILGDEGYRQIYEFGMYRGSNRIPELLRER